MTFPGKGKDPVLTNLVDVLADKIWQPLFDVLQYEDGPEFVAALGGDGFVPFFVQAPGNRNLTNLQSQGKIPFDFACDGICLHVASNDYYYEILKPELPSNHMYTVKQILREHGRFYMTANGTYIIADIKAMYVPSATGFVSAVGTTETTDELITQNEGVAAVGNYYRPGGPDPEMGLILPENTTIRAEWHIDTAGLDLLALIYPEADPLAKISQLGIQLTCMLQGWQARKFQP